MNLFKKIVKLKRFNITVLGILIISVIIFYQNSNYSKNKNIPLQENKIISNVNALQVGTIGDPVRLRIPIISVDAAVEQVGLTSNGSMDTPEDGINVAWFNLGKRPGDVGSAVITGHYGQWKSGQGSVFDNLNKLVVGDKLYVEDENGANITFVVREIRNYNPDADAVDIFSSDDEKSHLNLITCDGTWNDVSKGFSGRLVIFTDRE